MKGFSEKIRKQAAVGDVVGREIDTGGCGVLESRLCGSRLSALL